MKLDTSSFYNETSETYLSLKRFMRQLHKADEYEHLHNPESFNANSLSFHNDIVPNEEMDKLITEFAQTQVDYPKIVYAMFLVGEDVKNNPSRYTSCGYLDYLDLLRDEYENICLDNKGIASTLLVKHPWLIYDRVQHVMNKIGVIIGD
jgi:hypothetical protein